MWQVSASLEWPTTILSAQKKAAHNLCALLFAFSTAASDVASDLEDQAAGGRLDEARSLAGRLEAMATELVQLVDGLSIENLRHQVRAAGKLRADGRA